MGKTKIQPVFRRIIVSDFLELKRQGVKYEMGAKAASNAPISSIHQLDCSGLFYWQIARGSGGKTIPPHGSQNQLAWAEKNLEEVDYIDAVRYMTRKRLFVAFMKPGEKGCGPVGHVWQLAEFNDGNNDTIAGTLECHFGVGVNSRPWNYPSLRPHVYKCFEIPTLENLGN